MTIENADPDPLSETPPLELRRAQEERLLEAWRTPTGWRYRSAVNNSEVGLWYCVASFGFFLFGGILTLLIRIQLAVPGNRFLSAGQYNRVFTLHGSVMMFLFAVPIFEAISILLLRQMLIAGDLLLEMERTCDWPFFDATRGGEPLV